MRTALWEPPFALPGLVPSPFAAEPVPISVATPAPAPASAMATQPTATPDRDWPGSVALATVPAPLILAAAREPVMPLSRTVPVPLAHATVAELPTVPVTIPHVAAAHQLLYLAALGPLPLPPDLALLAMPPKSSPEMTSAPPAALATATSRWSGDGWLLVRRGSGGLAAASGFPSYGASQAGGVIRFALAPNSPHAPQAYARLSRAIGGFDESEVAAGLSARPFANLPLRLLGEARVQRGPGGTRVRPAASLVSELPPVRLPLGIVGEAYAQVGYAGAPLGAKRGATAFFDVQAVAERKLASAGPAELRLGAGAWSGGQKGVARLDLGPRASLRLATGPATSRLALDWRFRVAGNARPASGPTLTFSTGF